MPPITISFVARSNTGKTTLLEKLIPELKKQGFKVGVIKHDAHRFDIDHPGKDSYRMTAAGADTMLIASAEKLAIVKKHDSEPSLKQLVDCYFHGMDIVLAEGFKIAENPKIEIHRGSLGAELLCRGYYNDPDLIAIASDSCINSDVTILNLNDIDEVSGFILNYCKLKA